MASSENGVPNPASGQEDSSQDHSAASSIPASRGGSRPPKERHRVRFNEGGESIDTAKQKTSFDLRNDDSGAPAQGYSSRTSFNRDTVIPEARRAGALTPSTKTSTTGDVANSSLKVPILRPSQPPRPSIMRLPSSASSDSDEGLEMPLVKAPTGPGKAKNNGAQTAETAKEENDNDKDVDEDDENNDDVGKIFSQQTAHERAARLSRSIGTQSAPASRHASPIRKPVALSPPPSPPLETAHNLPIDLRDIPLEKLSSRRTKYGIEDESDEEDLDDRGGQDTEKRKSRLKRFMRSSKRRLRERTTWKQALFKPRDTTPPLQSGQVTPVEEQDHFDYVPRPKQYREGYLSSLMKLYDQQGIGSAFAHLPSSHHAIDASINKRNAATASLLGSSYTTPAQTPQRSPTSTESPTPGASPPISGSTTPKIKHEKWYYKNQQHRSTGSIADLVTSSTLLAQPGIQGSREQGRAIRPQPKHRPRSQQALDTVMGKKKKYRRDEDIRIQIHMAETIQRKAYILKMCKALMSYGAPTHRLEEYLKMSARVLSIEGQFLYIPGCMVVSFDDSATHTTEVKIVRTNQAVNLGKLFDSHQVYKEVIHDTIGVEEAMTRLDDIIKKPNRYSRWFLVLIYGLASAFVGPFAFGARPIDLPIAFFLGCLLGGMQLILAPYSDLYSNIFEISAAVLTSFLARAFGSIHGGDLFCFSALAQSSIALILPGYLVLCGSLELQSRNMVAGSVRMVYAIIYSFFLGFGITIGSSLYGWADHNATSATTCSTTWPFWWKVIFVPPFTLCLILINQGKLKQMPVMLAIAFAGYIVNYFSAIRFASNAQIANTLGALAIGILGNSYSRIRHGLAVTALLPAIFVQVPSGLAASGSLVSGVTSANQITHNDANGTTTVNNGTQAGSSGLDINTAVLNVGFSMIQVAIGITVGLFLSALVIYPFGKRRSGLFSF